MGKSESEEMKLLANVGGRGMWIHRAGGTREQHLAPGLPLSVGVGMGKDHRRGWEPPEPPAPQVALPNCHLDTVQGNKTPVGTCVCFSDKRGWTYSCHPCSIFPP